MRRIRINLDLIKKDKGRIKVVVEDIGEITKYFASNSALLISGILKDKVDENIAMSALKSYDTSPKGGLVNDQLR